MQRSECLRRKATLCRVHPPFRAPQLRKSGAVADEAGALQQVDGPSSARHPPAPDRGAQPRQSTHRRGGILFEHGRPRSPSPTTNCASAREWHGNVARCPAPGRVRCRSHPPRLEPPAGDAPRRASRRWEANARSWPIAGAPTASRRSRRCGCYGGKATEFVGAISASRNGAPIETGETPPGRRASDRNRAVAVERAVAPAPPTPWNRIG